MKWNELLKITKTRKPHRCEGTGRVIPEGSSCWRFVGEFERDFQNWYLCDEAKQFMDDNPQLFNDPDGYFCSEIGDHMREAERARSAPESTESPNEVEAEGQAL